MNVACAEHTQMCTVGRKNSGLLIMITGYITSSIFLLQLVHLHIKIGTSTIYVLKECLHVHKP